MKRDYKERIRLLKPGLDQWITIYMITLGVAIYNNMSAMSILVAISVMLPVIIIPYHKKRYIRHGDLRRNSMQIVESMSRILTGNWIASLIPVSIIIISTISPIAGYASVVLSSLSLAFLVVFGTLLARGQLSTLLARNDSGEYCDKAVFFQNSNLFKMTYRDIVIYLYINASNRYNIFEAINKYDIDMRKTNIISDEIKEAIRKELILSNRYHEANNLEEMFKCASDEYKND